MAAAVGTFCAVTPCRIMQSFIAGALLLGGCARDEPRNVSRQPMLAAVMNSGPKEVRELAEKGIGLNERYYANQATPMTFAASTDQWEAVEILIDHGADIWAHDMFGVTAAQRMPISRIAPGTPADAARLRSIAKLKARGYPWPPPDSDEVMRLEKAGRWPPPSARSAQ